MQVASLTNPSRCPAPPPVSPRWLLACTVFAADWFTIHSMPTKEPKSLSMPMGRRSSPGEGAVVRAERSSSPERATGCTRTTSRSSANPHKTTWRMPLPSRCRFSSTGTHTATRSTSRSAGRRKEATTFAERWPSLSTRRFFGRRMEKCWRL